MKAILTLEDFGGGYVKRHLKFEDDTTGERTPARNVASLCYALCSVLSFDDLSGPVLDALTAAYKVAHERRTAMEATPPTTLQVSDRRDH